jgi:Tfp pilus assembly protein PilF
MIAEYRYLADGLAAQFSPLHRKFTGDGHLFLFEGADTAVRFGLRLIESWRASPVEAHAGGRPPLRVGCHFGECVQLDGADEWVGRGIILAKRVETSAASDSLYATESVLELLDLPLYEIHPAGAYELKGDHLATRMLYRIAPVAAAEEAGGGREQTAEGWFLRGLALRSSAKAGLDEERCYREALRLRPDYAACHNNLAVVLRERGDESGAAEHYREALRLRPEYPEAHYNYGILLEHRGLSGAEHHYRAALAARPDYVDAHHRLANLLLRTGQRDESEAEYLATIGLRPQYPEAHNNYAIFLDDAGRDSEAAEHYEFALALRPSYPEAHYNYALLLERTGDKVAARSHYDGALAPA